MKRRIMFLSILMTALLMLPAFGASLESAMRAEYVAQPHGRQATSGNSVALELSYNDGTNSKGYYAQAGVSGTAADIVLNLYENGSIVTATRFANFDGTIECSGYKLSDIVSAINGDSSGYWKAKLGPDAYGSMNAEIILNDPIVDCNGSANNPASIYVAPDTLKGLSVGVQANEDGYVRLKQVAETTRAYNTSSSTLPITHTINVYDGPTRIYTQAIRPADTCIGTATTDEDATTNTVDFAAITNGKGLAASYGNSLCVTVEYLDSSTLSMGGLNDKATGSVSIIYDEIEQ